ncbi:MAG: hypothetical protein SF162_15490 [bacterium]|nr:hypothetical protein [bacterium]
MHFILYTDKTVKESLKSITERLQIKGTNSRPGLDGWIDKNGMFSISVNAPVVGNVPRRTHLRGRLENENGYTVVRGDVPSGATPFGIGLMFAAMGVMALMLLNSGNQLLALAVAPAAAYLYVILRGDDQNSEYLLDELMKVLRAKETPPKAGARKPSVSAPLARPAPKPAARAGSPAKPAAKGPSPRPAAKTGTAPKAGAKPAAAAARPASSGSKPAAPKTSSFIS